MLKLLTQNEVSKLSRNTYEWYNLGRQKDNRELVWIEDNADLTGINYEDTGLTLEQSGYSELVKESRLANMKVTVISGVRFYADTISYIDIFDAVEEAKEMGVPDTTTKLWKTPDGKIEVTLADLKEVRPLRLNKKAEIIGV